MINEKSESINKIVSENINIFQHKLIRMKDKYILKESPVDKQYKIEKDKLAQKIENLKVAKKQTESKEYKTELEEKVTSFYKNPFQFMDYIIEKYCKNNFIQFNHNSTNSKRKTFIKKSFLTFQTVVKRCVKVICFIFKMKWKS
jgi:hypothetical protein